jgi:hypothetical protein
MGWFLNVQVPSRLLLLEIGTRGSSTNQYARHPARVSTRPSCRGGRIVSPIASETLAVMACSCWSEDLRELVRVPSRACTALRNVHPVSVPPIGPPVAPARGGQVFRLISEIAAVTAFPQGSLAAAPADKELAVLG